MTWFEAQTGLLGQNITADTDRVWITKTHWPVPIAGGRAFQGNKMVVIQRNPIDITPSMFQLLNTQSHSLEIAE